MPSSWPITPADLPLLIQFSTACRLNDSSYLRRACTGVCFIDIDGSLFPDSTVRQFETAPDTVGIRWGYGGDTVGERRGNGGSAPRTCRGPQLTASATPTIRTPPGLANPAPTRRPMSSRANLPETTPGLFPGEFRCFRLEWGAVVVAGRVCVNSSRSGCAR